MPVVGLTGGIASGKSTAAQYARDFGATVVDADLLGHDAYGRGTPGHVSVLSEFGPRILASDGSIDRKSLGAIVFNDPDALRKLTDIVWPVIHDMAGTHIDQVLSQDPNAIVVLEAAVLIDAEWMDLCDEVWVVQTEEATAIERAVQRDSVSHISVKSRMSSLISDVVRSSFADVIFHNDGSLECLKSQVQAELERLTCNRTVRG